MLSKPSPMIPRLLRGMYGLMVGLLVACMVLGLSFPGSLPLFDCPSAQFSVFWISLACINAIVSLLNVIMTLWVEKRRMQNEIRDIENSAWINVNGKDDSRRFRNQLRVLTYGYLPISLANLVWIGLFTSIMS